jgi:hypothetical protein
MATYYQARKTGPSFLLAAATLPLRSSATVMKKSKKKKKKLMGWFQEDFIGWMRLWSSYMFRRGRLQTM